MTGLGAAVSLTLSSSTQNRANSTDATLRNGKGPVAIAFSPDRTLLASGNGDGTISLWNLATHQVSATLTDSPVKVDSVAFSRDGGLLASGSNDGTISLWDVAAHEMITAAKGLGGSFGGARAFDWQGAILTSAGGVISVWNVATRVKITILTSAFAVNPVLNKVGSASGPNSMPLTSSNPLEPVQLWDASNLVDFVDRAGSETGVNDLAFSPDGKLLAAASADNTVHLWDFATHRQVATLVNRYAAVGEGNADHVVSLAFSPDGNFLAGGTGGGLLLLWDAATFKIITTFWQLYDRWLPGCGDFRGVQPGWQDPSGRHHRPDRHVDAPLTTKSRPTRPTGAREVLDDPAMPFSEQLKLDHLRPQPATTISHVILITMPIENRDTHQV